VQLCGQAQGCIGLWTICGVLPGVWGMFRLGRVLWVVEAQKGMFKVTWHGDVNSALVIIPLQGEATVPGGIPVFCDLVMFAECIQEVHVWHCPGWYNGQQSHLQPR